MVSMLVLYPKQDGTRFDFDYYLSRHIPLLKEKWGPLGMEKVEIMRGESALPSGAPTYAVCALLHFTSQDAIEKVLSASDEVMSDIANYTDVQPVAQVVSWV